MRRLAISLLAVALAAASPLRGQQSTTIGAFELRPVVGAFVPTGSMRDDFRDAMLVGAQGALEVSDNFHVLLGGFFSRDNTHVSLVGARHANIWQFDAGAEGNVIRRMGRDWLFRPFIGGGVGMRLYDFSSTAGSDQTAAAYGAVGTEFQRFEGALRLELRDYVTRSETPMRTEKKTRNDMGITLGFVYHVM